MDDVSPPVSLRQRREARAAAQLASDAALAANAAQAHQGRLVDPTEFRAGVPVSLDEQTYPFLRSQLVNAILDSATPERTDRLFPGDPQQLLRPHGGVSFGSGAAGVLWTLAEVDADVPAELVNWLEWSALRAQDLGPGLVDGLGGIALSLDRLGRSRSAARLWKRVEDAPLERLGASLADGLPGVGLALLERSRFTDADRLMDRVGHVTVELVARLRHGRARRGPGLLRGGAGAALFLLHVYELTGDDDLLPTIEHALRSDLALLGWAGIAQPGRSELWRTRPSLATGSAGVAVVLHEAMDYFDAPWMYKAREAIAQACDQHATAHPGLFHGWAGTMVALQYLRSRAWDPTADRRAAVQHQLARLSHPAVHGRIPFLGVDAEWSSADLSTGAAGVLLAFDVLIDKRARMPLLW
ncbi:MAG: lanthionine synthetase LanC family protein [Georgenia sp.]